MYNRPEEIIRLTQYSHGAGCGCKISPDVLDSILAGAHQDAVEFPSLLVGNKERDDAAVMDLGDGTAIISTTDFFMPIVDDPFTFGRIAAVNAISDVYAMGGTPLMAIAILGWPVNELSPQIAGEVIRGAQEVCKEAGIPLAGGHSIDSPEPIFGLAVTGKVDLVNIKKNGGAQEGDILFLTKPIGTGIFSTAQKKGVLQPEHEYISTGWMQRLNTIGEKLGKIAGVRAMTDVTGFGLAGHLIEMCAASSLSAEVRFTDIPLMDPAVLQYALEGIIPGGTIRNYSSYGNRIRMTEENYRAIICDPQTSGGLLIAVEPGIVNQISELLQSENLYAKPIGVMTASFKHRISVI
ncbi:MAG: selenide, water dikinase SelD [Bacteroidota bacterium]|nr:selenide, water dikinase SelD [Bacteroidota bacterium]